MSSEPPVAPKTPVVGRLDRRDALLIVDVQNCFCSGGTLGVPRGEDVVPVVNALMPRFGTVVATQDWHPPGHASFASAHPGHQPFDSIRLGYGDQVLWPDHAVQGSHDAQLHADLLREPIQLIVRKGFHEGVDSYSAFMEADRRTLTGLASYLRERDARRVWIVGLATDFCVLWTALDAVAAGFQTRVIEDATRAIDLDGSLAAAWKRMRQAGVGRVQSADVPTLRAAID